jgi:hypothetical protein
MRVSLRFKLKRVNPGGRRPRHQANASTSTSAAPGVVADLKRSPFLRLLSHLKNWIPGAAFGRALLAPFRRSRNPFRFPPMRVTIPDAKKGKGTDRGAVPHSRAALLGPAIGEEEGRSGSCDGF